MADRMVFRQVAAGAAGAGTLIALAGLALAFGPSFSKEINVAWLPELFGGGFLLGAGAAAGAAYLSTRPDWPVGGVVALAAVAATAGAAAAGLIQVSIVLRDSGISSAGAGPSISAGLAGSLGTLTWLGAGGAVANAAAAVLVVTSRVQGATGRPDLFAVAGLSLGVAGLLLSFSIVGALAAPVAAILGGIGAWRALNGDRRGLGEAQAAIVLGVAVSAFYGVLLLTRA